MNCLRQIWELKRIYSFRVSKKSNGSRNIWLNQGASLYIINNFETKIAGVYIFDISYSGYCYSQNGSYNEVYCFYYLVYKKVTTGELFYIRLYFHEKIVWFFVWMMTIVTIHIWIICWPILSLSSDINKLLCYKSIYKKEEGTQYFERIYN